MKTNLIFVLIFVLISCEIKSQHYLPKDTIYGNVKKIREKVIFLTEIENPQLLYYDDYGHSGFMGPESTISRFRNTWFTSNLCYYINYERTFNTNNKVIRDVWFGKQDNFINSYIKKYDKENRILKEIDSTRYSLYTTTYYYSNYGDVNILRQNSENHFFSHKYQKFENKKLKIEKVFDDNGTVYEHKYFYNDDKKLKYRIYKNPNSWKDEGEGTWSYGIQDSILTVYKDIVNEYDAKKRLIKQQEFDLYQDNINHKNPLLTNQTEFIYAEDKLILRKRKYRTGLESYDHYKYDKTNQINTRYCCDKNIENAMIIEKFKFDKGIITNLKYTEEKKEYNISFRYKFDNNNNWIEIIKNVNGKDLFKWIRQIEYF